MLVIFQSSEIIIKSFHMIQMAETLTRQKRVIFVNVEITTYQEQGRSNNIS
jgi:hypothetical protein